MTLLVTTEDEPQGSFTALRWGVTVPGWVAKNKRGGPQPTEQQGQGPSQGQEEGERHHPVWCPRLTLGGAGKSCGNCLGPVLTGPLDFQLSSPSRQPQTTTPRRPAPQTSSR